MAKQDLEWSVCPKGSGHCIVETLCSRHWHEWIQPCCLQFAAIFSMEGKPKTQKLVLSQMDSWKKGWFFYVIDIKTSNVLHNCGKICCFVNEIFFIWFKNMFLFYRKHFLCIINIQIWVPLPPYKFLVQFGWNFTGSISRKLSSAYRKPVLHGWFFWEVISGFVYFILSKAAWGRHFLLWTITCILWFKAMGLGISFGQTSDG